MLNEVGLNYKFKVNNCLYGKQSEMLYPTTPNICFKIPRHRLYESVRHNKPLDLFGNIFCAIPWPKGN